MIHIQRNPDKLEAKALDYERKGKTNKAIKYREKAARIRSTHPGQLGLAANPIPVTNASMMHPPAGAVLQRPLGAPVSTVGGVPLSAGVPLNAGINPGLATGLTPRTPAMYEANALKWEQRGNWAKAQKNREKVWRLRNPQHQSATAPAFYRDNRFLGYDLAPGTAILPGAANPTLPTVHAPLSQQPLGYGAHGLSPMTPLGMAQQGISPMGAVPYGTGLKKRDPLALEAKAAEYERRGKTAKANKLRSKAERVRAGTYVGSQRTPDLYERNALKWEQRGNYEKAQKNRAKAWRHKYPQHASHQPPMFYNNNKFLGYDVPLSGAGLGNPYGGQIPMQGGQFPTQGMQGFDMMRPSRDPARLEARAAEWEAKGKPQKAMRLRNKAAQLRSGTYVSRRTPEMYERNALKWEQRGNWDKAQKNRAKVWRMNNPQYAQHIGPNFYNNNRFVGYNVPFTASESTMLPYFRNNLGAQRGLGGGYGAVPAGMYGAGLHGGKVGRDPARLEAKAAQLEAKGKPEKALRLRNKAAQLRAGTYVGGQRTPDVYERHALKWEQRGNYEKAQKSRAKAWRLRNPHYAQHTGPSFYSNNRFLGYDVPFTASESTLLPYYRQTTTTTTTYPGGVGGVYGASTFPVGATGIPIGGVQPVHAQHGVLGLLPSRDPAQLEARAIEAERKGKPQKALKLREKAAKIRSGQHNPRNVAAMEAKALRWEQEGNWKRAQKQRAKIWRLQNPQYISSTTVPTFYNNNIFLGYNVPFSGMSTTQYTTGTTQYTTGTTHLSGTHILPGQTYTSGAGIAGVTTGISQVSLAPHTVYAAPIVEQVVRPTIVTETQRPERIVEVQPVIHREVEAPTLKIIEQHVYETVPSVGPNTITNAAIVHETVVPHITEEIQQIVHREVPAPFVERVEQHVTEHIVQPVVQTKEVIQDTTVHAVAAGAPLLATSGVGLGLQQQTLIGGMGGVQQTVVGGQQTLIGGMGGIQQQTLVGAPVVTEQTTTTTTVSQQPGVAITTSGQGIIGGSGQGFIGGSGQGFIGGSGHHHHGHH